MKRCTFLFGLAAVLMSISVYSAASSIFVVGSCKTARIYSTIQAAINAAEQSGLVNPAVQVCPGTYPEQVTITKPLVLQGLVASDGSGAVIAAPKPLPPSSPYAQLAVQNTGAGVVTISNISLNGSGDSVNCVLAIQFINASGTMNHISALAQNDSSSCGNESTVILAETNDGSTQSVTIENSSLRIDSHKIGIDATVPSGKLSVTISGNTLAASLQATGIELAGGGTLNATVSANNILNTNVGISPSTSSGTMLITGNSFLYGNFGIVIAASPAGTTIKGNKFWNVPFGIDLKCDSSITLTGNVFNGTTTAFSNVPSGFSTGHNSFYNVPVIAYPVCS